MKTIIKLFKYIIKCMNRFIEVSFCNHNYRGNIQFTKNLKAIRFVCKKCNYKKLPFILTKGNENMTIDDWCNLLFEEPTIYKRITKRKLKYIRRF